MTRLTNGRAGERSQSRALASAFLTRFFDNDITGGADDLKKGYFSLVAFLAAPPFLVAIMMLNRWEITARYQGLSALRAEAMSGKLLYLSFSMVVSGALAAMTWTQLMLDRRDALILGALPVPSRTIVRAKLIALGGYLVILALAMHGLSSFSFGVGLAVGNTFEFLVRGVVAHFMAATSASLFLMLAVTSVQGVLLAALGPRVFARLSSFLQMALIAGVLVGFVALPLFARSTEDTIAGVGPDARPWLLWTPPYWFLGTYETVLGTDNRTLIALNWRGVLALTVVTATTLGSYAAAYARLARAAVEGSDSPRPRRAAAVSEFLTTAIVRRPASRAAVQFFLLSLARVERLRFIVAVAAGMAIGWSAPVLFVWAAGRTADGPSIGLLALSLADVALLVMGLRVAASMPCDLGAAWIVPAADPAPARLRSAVWRALFVTGVLPIIVLFGSLHAWFWGPASALRHALVLGASGALAVEILLWNYERMPCARAWRPERLELGNRWPLYAAAFLLFSRGIAAVEVRVAGSATAFAAFLAGLIVIVIIVRVAHARRLVMPVIDDEVIGAPAVLRLD